MTDIKVLYEDNHTIAVYKPAGILVQGDISGDKNLLDELKEYIKIRDGKPGNVFIGLVHRLDRNASGILLFAKTSKGAARLSEQFREHTVQKIYHTLVEGELKNIKGSLIHYLVKDEETRKAIVLDGPREGADLAELEYEVVRPGQNYSLVRINLKTGRFHQIRAQLAHIGHPIVGDKKYGSRVSLGDGSIALCATEVTFKKTTEEEIVDIKIEWPNNWNSYLEEN